MPGIAAIISKLPPRKNEEDLALMIGCMMHEPFYTSGAYVNEQLGVYAGWACHRGSFSDCMPVLNEKGNLVLLFAGENFVGKEVIDQLERRSHQFDHSNASYLVHLYEEDEEGFLEHLNGWFSGILVDLRKARLVLFNDRYGMHRVYYYEGKDEFLFSSEAKSLMKVRPELRKIDMKSLGEFFASDCILENRSLFAGISVLPGASSWTLHNSGEIEKGSYFKPDIWEGQPILEEEIFYHRLRETFLSILPRYFCAKQPIAMSLTSGLDTRTIMSYLCIGPGELPCYTFTGMYRDTLDAIIARKVADACNQTHLVVRLDREFFSDFPALAERTVYITDGCHDVWGTHDIYLNELVRKIAPIRMTGKFGSEVLGDFSMLKKTIRLRKELFHGDFRRYVDEAVLTFYEIKKGHKLTFAAFKETPWYQYGRLCIEMDKLTVRTPYMDNDLVKLMYQAPANTRSSKEIRLRLIGDGNPALGKIMTDRGTAGESNYLFSKCAQLFYYSSFKTEYIYLYQLPYWMPKLDKILAPMHPERLIVGRYQYVHPRIWFQKEIPDYIREILLDKRTANRPYLNKDFLGKMVHGHIKGEYNYVNEINKTLTAELIHRVLIESI